MTGDDRRRDQLQGELRDAIRSFDIGRLSLLTRVASALAVPVPTRTLVTHDLATPRVVESVGLQLALYHSMNHAKLNKKSFEYLMQTAFETDGRPATVNANTTDAGADLLLGSLRLSLKTQADGGIVDRAIYIQKLMEARWIRECSIPEDFAREGRARVMAHLAGYDRMLMLRAFDVSDTEARYQLVEIPLDVLRLVDTIRSTDLSPKNKYGSSGCEVRDTRGVAFRVLFDGSVEKVRVFNLRSDRCVSIAEWRVPRSTRGVVNED